MLRLLNAATWLAAAKLAFVVAAGIFIWLELQGHVDELGIELAQTAWWLLMVALFCVLAALAVTGLLWREMAAVLGHDLKVRDSFGIFFFGQLGKYIPGSIWSLGAQAASARRYGIEPRSTIATSLMFLGLHVVTGLALTAVLGLSGSDAKFSPWVWWLALAVSLIGIHPVVVRALVTRAAGVPIPALDSIRVAQFVGYMAVCWMLYAGSLLALRPDSDVQALMRLVLAYALGYVAGVLVVIAPAGLGAREAVFVMVLAPDLGVGEAAALAVLTRVLTIVGDLCLALFAAAALRIFGRGVEARTPVGAGQSRPKENADSRSCCE